MRVWVWKPAVGELPLVLHSQAAVAGALCRQPSAGASAGRPAGGVDRPRRGPGGACPRPQAAAGASREGIPAGTPILSRGWRRVVPSPVTRGFGRPGEILSPPHRIPQPAHWFLWARGQDSPHTHPTVSPDLFRRAGHPVPTSNHPAGRRRRRAFLGMVVEAGRRPPRGGPLGSPFAAP